MIYKFKIIKTYDIWYGMDYMLIVKKYNPKKFFHWKECMRKSLSSIYSKRNNASCYFNCTSCLESTLDFVKTVGINKIVQMEILDMLKSNKVEDDDKIKQENIKKELENLLTLGKWNLINIEEE